MSEVAKSKLTTEELEILKAFAATWLKVYSFMPPEGILIIFTALMRLAKIYEAQIKQIYNIQISQASSVNELSRHLENIAAQSMNRNMMR